MQWKPQRCPLLPQGAIRGWGVNGLTRASFGPVRPSWTFPRPSWRGNGGSPRLRLQDPERHRKAEGGWASPGAERAGKRSASGHLSSPSTWKAKWGRTRGRPEARTHWGPPLPPTWRPRRTRTDRAAGPGGRGDRQPPLGAPGRSRRLAPRDARLWQPPRHVRVGPPRFPPSV